MSGYALATVSNPSSAISNFPLFVDLSRMPASWWAAVDTSDGTKGRAYTGLGTRLPIDWINFNNGANTGYAIVRWDGSLAASGTQKVRIDPPKAANASVAAGDSFGQHAVYASTSIKFFWFNGASSDRTSNGNNPTLSGGVTAGGSTLNSYPATYFDGVNDSADVIMTRHDYPFTLISYIDMAYAGNGTGLGSTHTGADFSGDTYALMSNNAFFQMRDGSTNTVGSVSLTDVGAAAYVGWNCISNTSRIAYSGASSLSNGSDSTSVTIPAGSDYMDRYCNGAIARNAAIEAYNECKIMYTKLYTVSRSQAWHDQERKQLHSQSTMWGTWAWIAGHGMLLASKRNRLVAA